MRMMKNDLINELVGIFLYPDYEDLIEIYKKYKLGFSKINIYVTFNICSCRKFDLDLCDHNPILSDEEIRKTILIIAKNYFPKNQLKVFRYNLIKNSGKKFNYTLKLWNEIFHHNT